MPNRSNRNQRNNNENSSIENFSKLLDEHTKALLKFSEEFKKSADAFNKNFDKTTGQDQKHRVEIAKDARDMFERESRIRSESIVQGKKVGTALIDSFKVVGRALINEFDSAIERVASKYTSQLSAITTRMQISNKEYAQMFNDASAFFQNNGLIKQFSSADFADSLTAALETGLRGEEAQRQAYQNLITNKLVPAISTNTVAYRRMSKQFGDSFNEGITAIAKYTEKVYGAEGIEEGRINSIIETLGLSTRYAAAQQGMTKEQASQMASQTTGILTAIGSTIGENFQQQIVDMLYSSSRGETLTSGQNVLAGIAGVYTAQDAMQALSDPTKLSNVIGSVLSQYAQRNPDVLGVLGNSGLGYDVSAGQEAFIALQEKSSGQIVDELNNFTKGFNASQVYQEERDKLEQGYYQDSTTAMEKIFDNLSTWFAAWKTNIPMFDTIVNSIKELGKIWVGRQIFGGGSGSLFGKDISAAKELFGEGYSFKDVASAGGLKSASLGKLASVGGYALAGAAGLAYGGLNAYTAMQNTSQGQSRALSGLEGFLGDTSGARTAEEKLAVVRSNKGKLIDWSKVGTAAATGGLIGVGVGGIVGSAAGGIGAAPGAAIGGAIGAATGAIASMTEQVIKYRDAQKYATSELGKLSDTFEESKKKYKELVEEDKKYVSLAQQINSVNESLNDSTGIEKTLLEQKLVLLKQELELQSQMLGSAGDLKSSLDSMIDSYNKTKSQVELSTSLGNIGSAIKGLDLGKKKLSDISDKDLYTQLGISESDAEKIVGLAKSSGYLTSSAGTSEGLRALVADYGSGQEYWGTNIKGTDYDKVKVGGKSSYTAFTTSEIKKTGSDLSSMYSQISSTATEGGSNLSSMIAAGITSPEMIQKTIMNNLAPLLGISPDKSLKDLTGFNSVSAYLSGFNASTELIKSYEDFIKTNGLATDSRAKGWYKTGLGYVPTDNFLASLHRGEMVLTSHNADMLRQLTSGSSVGSFLSGLLNVSSTTASAATDESSTDVSSVVVTAINDQTTALSGILNSILDAIHQISHKSNPASASQISEATVSFDGV